MALSKPAMYWLYKQTAFAPLVLYVYLFWYVFNIAAFGARVLDAQAWENALVLALFIFFALNAAVYQPPLRGPKGYLRNKWQIIRFYLIPFCVSSVSVACKAAEEDCKFLFPTHAVPLILFFVSVLLIVAVGCLLHYVVLPKHLSGDELKRLDGAQTNTTEMVVIEEDNSQQENSQQENNTAPL